MKKQMIAAVCLALAAGLSAMSAAEATKDDPGKTLADASATAKQKMKAIEAYVDDVEKSASSFTRKEETLAADSLKKVTDETWSKMHAYFDGKELKRMKLYPGEGSDKTEEFYFYQDEPVFVFVEQNGKGKENHDENAVGTKYYFVDETFLAATAPDGKNMDEADAKKMASKLQKEATAMRGMLK